MKKLRRSRKNRVVCGVMGGIAEYFDVDPTIVRVLFLIVSWTGFPVFLYIYTCYHYSRRKHWVLP